MHGSMLEDRAPCTVICPPSSMLVDPRGGEVEVEVESDGDTVMADA
tara:strand:- start:345 stop:482 length:138 start_codon:yes stop_codon:yes gene_type:complete